MQAYTYISKGKFELVEKSKPVLMHERDVPVICISNTEVCRGRSLELQLVMRW